MPKPFYGPDLAAIHHHFYSDFVESASPGVIARFEVCGLQSNQKNRHPDDRKASKRILQLASRPEGPCVKSRTFVEEKQGPSLLFGR
jgi:hypothetical protein